MKLENSRLRTSAFSLCYDPLLLGFCLLQLPGFLRDYYTTDKYREDFQQRLGLYEPEMKRQFSTPRSGWIHSVSVGEVVAATPVVKRLMARYPDLPLTLSTVTRTGRQMLEKSLGPQSRRIFLPFDFRRITERVMQQILPRFLLITETELWPNLIRSAYQRNIPVMIMNGRISSTSYQRYRLVRSWLSSILPWIKVLAMQSPRDAERIISLGAPPQAVFVTGNLKFDQAGHCISLAEQEGLAQELRLPPQALIWMAGSTHPGEEKIILEVYQRLLPSFPELILIIAPRHLPEVPEIEAQCQQKKLSFIRKTQLIQKTSQPPSLFDFTGRVIILDTIGELSKMYSLATVVFIGGSLVPVGGHNLLEPAAYGKPVIYGSYLDNFRDISLLLKEAGAGFEVEHGEALKNQLSHLLGNEKARDLAGQAARSAIKKNGGATEKTLALIEKYLLP